MSMQKLILRSNRFLASALMENRLITSEDVEKANEKLLSYFQSGKTRYASVLRILIYDLKVLNENDLINRLVEQYNVGLVHLGHFHIGRAPMEGIEVDECWATMTAPYDRIGNAVCLATCYYLSKPVIEYWEKKIPNILWYTTTVDSLTTALESITKPDESE